MTRAPRGRASPLAPTPNPKARPRSAGPARTLKAERCNKCSDLRLVHASVFLQLNMKNAKPDLAYEFIRKRILNGEFKPGRPLMTEQLSAAIGVSRTPVSEALLKLQADGLVTIRARIGASVKTLTFSEFCDICDMRLALEAHAAGRAAAHHTDTDLREIRFALERMSVLTGHIIAAEDENKFLDDLVREDVRFHVGILAAAKNDLVRKEILRLHLINRIVALPRLTAEVGSKLLAVTKSESDANRRAVMASHQEIFEAISRRDSEAAKSAMERHFEDIVSKMLKRIRPEIEAVARELTPEELAYIS